MLEEAITRIEKQIELYKVQDSNLSWSRRKYTAENIVKEKLKREIRIWKYILKILQERREQDATEKRDREN